MQYNGGWAQLSPASAGRNMPGRAFWNNFAGKISCRGFWGAFITKDINIWLMSIALAPLFLKERLKNNPKASHTCHYRCSDPGSVGPPFLKTRLQIGYWDICQALHLGTSSLPAAGDQLGCCASQSSIWDYLGFSVSTGWASRGPNFVR